MKSTSEQKKETGRGACAARRIIVAERAGRLGWRTHRRLEPEASRTIAEIQAKILSRELSEALGLLRHLQAAQPAAFWRSGRWRLWEQVGVALRNGDPSGAAEAFAVLHTLRPHHVPTLLRLGEAWMAAGEYGRAFHACYSAQELAADDPGVHFLLGSLYGQKEDIPKARRHLERAVALAPDQGEYWAALGYALQALGETDRALTAYRRAARLLPKEPSVWNALGLLHAQAGEPRQGLSALLRGLRLRPGDPGILLNLSTIYGRDLEDFDRASRYALRLLEIDPDNAGAHHNLGLIYWAMGEVVEAQDHLRRALELGSDAPEIWASYNAFRRFLGDH